MTTFYIYTLKNPKTKDIFYVGCTTMPEMRLRQHHNTSNKKCTKAKYIKEMKCIPEMIIIEQITMEFSKSKKFTPKEVKEREMFWIGSLHRSGHKLLNKIGINNDIYRNNIKFNLETN